MTTHPFPWQINAGSSHKHNIALRDFSQGEVFTWTQLTEKIASTAEMLVAQGVRTQSGVALCGKNGFALLCCYLAGLQLNARVLVLNPAFCHEKRTALCRQNAIDLMIDFTQSKSVFIKSENENVAECECIDSVLPACTMTLTSGSAGMPKAVLHSVRNHLDNARGVCELMHFSRDSSWLLSLPLYHVSGQGIVWRWLLQGAELQLPAEDFYHGVITASHASLVPTQAQRLLQYLAERTSYGVKSAVNIRHILLGGSHITKKISENLTALGIRTYVGYGMTEMASTVFAKEYDGKAGVGRPLRGREFQLVNEEIQLRGAGLGLGYWLKGKPVPLTNSAGWLQTKDKGVWDGENLQVLGRLDNMFISGGENIQPEEIERILQRHDQVEVAFVLPIDDEEFGQRPVAMVQFKSCFSKSAVKNLQVWLADKLEKFKRPVRYFPLDTATLAQQGNIKLSRVRLKQELNKILGIKSCD
ncbi:2-succinylbenzoate-CoA ligase [Actinobacillus succinogenes]|uniref:O-succinylbenzoate-CoA ligase n=1 Tax=Actinobacillus succinogenes (strain ATCC 55618 / DSM 22257 / CCUG 43843 / 130Z) TaxID=339671 RepID=A6VMY5_ACTSZ|nr:o-succinylbenzoate--CoA ligase [Actinobacillus succinogenes]ABR74332.1 O-succinylbenzoate-CoA ligase [Actinobacillus succinogenes 130Z]PHI41180.1 2-succinylbenzoate-CoA ligase [Actinobacillus succinogenes]